MCIFCVRRGMFGHFIVEGCVCEIHHSTAVQSKLNPIFINRVEFQILFSSKYVQIKLKNFNLTSNWRWGNLWVVQGEMYPSWCVAKTGVNNLDLSDYVRLTCRKDPNSCRIILPGGLCFDSYSNMVIRNRSQASFLLHKEYGLTKKCNKKLGQIISHYPRK